MAKVKKDHKSGLYVGALVRYVGVSASESMETSDVLLVNDLIHVTEVPEDTGNVWIRGIVVERAGVQPEDILEDYFQQEEVEAMGTYQEWLDAQNGTEVSDEDFDIEEAEPIKQKKSKKQTKEPKTKEKKEKTTNKKQLAVVTPSSGSSDGVLVEKRTNDLMTYLNRTNLHQAALELANINHMSDAVLAKVLANIYDNKVYMEYIDTDTGEESNFIKYIEAYFANKVHYRKAMYLVNTCKFLESRGMSEAEVVAYINDNGYAKIQKLMSLEKYLGTDEGKSLLERDPNIMDDMLARAKSVGRDKLQEEIESRISTETVNVSTDQRTLTHIKLYMFDDQFETYQQALTEYRDENAGMVDGASDSAIVYAIMQDWMSSRAGRAPSLEEDIENLQARHGVEIKVIPHVRKA